MKMNTIKKRILSRATDNSEKGHTNEILCLALSDDFKFLVSSHFLSKFYFIYFYLFYNCSKKASSGRDRSIKIWNPESCEFIYAFEGHRDAVSVKN